MALIVKRDAPELARPLVSTQVLGRAPTCRLHDDNGHVSSHHAEIWWDGVHWLIEDLGSRNGTWVDDRRLLTRKAVTLQDGSTIAVGRRGNVWLILTTAPPVALAEDPDGTAVTASNGVITLPDDDNPQVAIYQNHHETWLLDRDGDLTTITTAHQVVIDNQIWTLYLPNTQAQTFTNLPTAPSPRTAQVELCLHQDGSVDARLIRNGEQIIVSARSSHQLLLLLSQARRHDVADGLPPTEQGWLHQSDVAEALALTINALNAALHRLRAQFANAGMMDAAGVIERRAGTGLMRLGLEHVTIVTIDD